MRASRSQVTPNDMTCAPRLDSDVMPDSGRKSRINVPVKHEDGTLDDTKGCRVNPFLLKTWVISNAQMREELAS